jgi:hypothetical protein
LRGVLVGGAVRRTLGVGEGVGVKVAVRVGVALGRSFGRRGLLVGVGGGAEPSLPQSGALLTATKIA